MVFKNIHHLMLCLSAVRAFGSEAFRTLLCSQWSSGSKQLSGRLPLRLWIPTAEEVASVFPGKLSETVMPHKTSHAVAT